MEAFSEWISHSSHFTIIPLPLGEDWQRALATSERHQQRSRAEYQNCPMHNLISSELDSTPQLVGCALTSMAHLGQTEETGSGHTPRAPISQLRGRPSKGCPAKDGARNSPSSSPDRGGANSDGYSMVSDCIALATTEEGSKVRNDWHPHIWICQFSSRLTEMQM